MRQLIPNPIDIRWAVRQLARSPGFTAIAALTLALGIGANTAIFSILNEVFLRPIPLVPNQDRLAALARTLDGGEWEGFTHSDYLEYRARRQALDGLMAFRRAGVNLACGSEVRRATATLVSDNYFRVLGIKATLGRTFLPEEDRTPGSHPVAVASQGLWARCFASESSALGRTIRMNGGDLTIIGVAPAAFAGTELDEASDVWIPLMMEGLARRAQAGHRRGSAARPGGSGHRAGRGACLNPRHGQSALRCERPGSCDPCQRVSAVARRGRAGRLRSRAQRAIGRSSGGAEKRIARGRPKARHHDRRQKPRELPRQKWRVSALTMFGGL